MKIEELRQALQYEPETGILRWKISPRNDVNPGDIAGSLDTEGYVILSFKGHPYKAHRLAWMYVHGALPDKNIDHINQNKQDNRIANLRLCTNSENHQNTSPPANNTSGHKGVTWNKKDRKWRAQIKLNYRLRYIGSFDSKEQAIAARKQAEKEMHPFRAKDQS